jgi:multiple sugar transport system permease protein
VTVIPGEAEMSPEAAAVTRPPRPPFKPINLVIDIVLLVFCVLMLLPLLFLISNAFKTPQEILSWPPTLIPRTPILDNFTAVLTTTPLLRWIGNSLLFAVLSTICIVATSSVGGYIFAKFRFRSLHLIFLLFLATAIVPFEIYMIPLYFQAQQLHILNSIWGLLLGYRVMGFGIFLIRQNVEQTIPNELLDAARIDGASEISIFLLIVLPLLRGALAALAVLAFFQAWTAFAWPLIVGTTKDSYTIEVGLALFQTGFTIDLGRLSAASTVVLVPSVVLFAILRRNFVRGITATGLKE